MFSLTKLKSFSTFAILVVVVFFYRLQICKSVPYPSIALDPILDTFSHCTTIVKFKLTDSDFISLHPILVYIDSEQMKPPAQNPGYDHHFMFENVSFTHRNQDSNFCWTYIFPDMGVKFLISNLMYSSMFPSYSGSTAAVYYIWIMPPIQEAAKLEMETIYKKILISDINILGTREFYFFQPHSGTPRFYHLNRYYRQETFMPTPVPSMILEKIGQYTEIQYIKGHKLECFHSIERTIVVVAAALNKFFWTYMDWLEDDWQIYTFTDKFVRMHNKHFLNSAKINWINVAKESDTLDDFIAYTILSEALDNISLPSKVYYKEKYIYSGKGPLRYSASNHQIILTGSQSYSFVSCYGIQRQKSYEVFTAPFDQYTWACIFLTIFVLTTMHFILSRFLYDTNNHGHTTGTLSSTSNFDVFIITFTVILEISFSTTINRVIPSKLKSIFWFWIFCSMALTSFYKNLFTAEVILPYKRIPLWTHIYDLEELGFTFLLPLRSNIKDYYDMYSNGIQIDSVFAFEFSSEAKNAAMYEGNLPRLLGYKKVAKAIMASDPDSDVGPSVGGVHVKRIWKEVHYKWPSHLYPKLSQCQAKVAYVDETSNIEKIIPFLNDNVDGKVFLKGKDDGFLLTYYGFQIDQTPRGNFVTNRMKALINSGIHLWWEKWFERTRPKKLFPYYANWYRPSVGALEKLDFESKFVTTLEIWGVCCGICVFVFAVEVVQYIFKDNKVRSYRN